LRLLTKIYPRKMSTQPRSGSGKNRLRLAQNGRIGGRAPMCGGETRSKPAKWFGFARDWIGWRLRPPAPLLLRCKCEQWRAGSSAGEEA
jgi:hypothetical protein